MAILIVSEPGWLRYDQHSFSKSNQATLGHRNADGRFHAKLAKEQSSQREDFLCGLCGSLRLGVKPPLFQFCVL